MPGTNYDAMEHGERLRAIAGMAASTWPWDVTETALRGILGYNDILVDAITRGVAGVVPLTIDDVKAYTTTLRGYLNVAMPAVPNDLGTLTAGDALTLVKALELATWDWNRRRNALDSTMAFYRQRVTGKAAPPTIVEFRNTFLDIANAVRVVRGLTAIAQ